MHHRVFSGAHLPVTPVSGVLYIVLSLECSTQDHSKQPSHEGHSCHCQIVPAVHNLGLNRPAMQMAHRLAAGVGTGIRKKGERRRKIT